MSENNINNDNVQTAEPVVENPPHPSDTDKSLFMGILSYLGILVIIPLLFSKDDPFVKFHIKQGLVLVVCEAVLWVAMKLFWPLMPIIGILQIALIVLSIIGIINVVQKKQKNIPLVGQYADKIKL